MAIFKDRYEAGVRLSEAVRLPENSVIFAIPRGGVPVGAAIAERYRLPFDIIVVRKLPIPWNPEAGFGAISPDGEVVLNPELSSYLSEEEIRRLSLPFLLFVLQERKDCYLIITTMCFV